MYFFVSVDSWNEVKCTWKKSKKKREQRKYKSWRKRRGRWWREKGRKRKGKRKAPSKMEKSRTTKKENTCVCSCLRERKERKLHPPKGSLFWLSDCAAQARWLWRGKNDGTPIFLQYSPFCLACTPSFHRVHGCLHACRGTASELSKKYLHEY